MIQRFFLISNGKTANKSFFSMAASWDWRITSFRRPMEKIFLFWNIPILLLFTCNPAKKRRFMTSLLGFRNNLAYTRFLLHYEVESIISSKKGIEKSFPQKTMYRKRDWYYFHNSSNLSFLIFYIYIKTLISYTSALRTSVACHYSISSSMFSHCKSKHTISAFYFFQNSLSRAIRITSHYICSLKILT